MWTCPNCQHKFYNRNQAHSCGNYSVEDLLKGKPEKVIDLFNHFITEYRKIGEFELHPVKTRIALLTKMRFCSVNRLGKGFIDIHFVLTTPYTENSCFRRIENVGDRFFLHHLRVSERNDINTEVKNYMKLAYAVGNREHVEDRKK